MHGYLLDTCVISESTHPQPAPKVLAWLAARSAESLYLSSISLGELEQGIARLGKSARATRLQRWLHEVVVPQFESRILDVDPAVARRWGRLQGEALRRGKPLPVIDSWIAATAQEHGLAVVTRNIGDFERIDVRCINPWQ